MSPQRHAARLAKDVEALVGPPSITAAVEILRPTAPTPEQVAVDLELSAIADRIRERLQRITTDMIATGRDLLLVQEKVGHGNFIKWIEAEFGMTDRTARNYMRAAEWAEGKPEIISVLPPTTIYMLAAPTAPKEITAEVVADLEAGRPVDHRSIEGRIKMDREIEREKKRAAANRRYRRKAVSPATQRRREAEELKRQAEVAAGERQWTEGAAEAMAIIEQLPADAIFRLTELFVNFGVRQRVLEMLSRRPFPTAASDSGDDYIGRDAEWDALCDALSEVPAPPHEAVAPATAFLAVLASEPNNRPDLAAREQAVAAAAPISAETAAPSLRDDIPDLPDFLDRKKSGCLGSPGKTPTAP